MKSKKRSKRPMHEKLTKTLMSVFVLVVIMLPAYSSAIWVKGVVFDSRDPRKLSKVETMQARTIDRDTSGLKPFHEPIISVTFDDGWESTYTTALPMLQQYGIPTTEYIIAGVFNNPLYMSKSQLHSMQGAGHEIASHTMTHPDLTLLDDSTLNWELTESKKELTREFGPIYDFASPLGAADQRTIAAIKRVYRSQRNTEGDPNTEVDHGVNLTSEFDIYNIKGYTVRRSTTLKDLQGMIGYTIQHNGWLVLTYHQVETRATGDDKYTVTPAALRQQLQLISRSLVHIDTVGQVLNAYEAMH